ncbi:MAG: hypothetical protein JXR61_03765 [Prolixibacteraceae bacterium]|nr:hypothetical protein [Prolixibacteraceae bacterium]
MKKSVFLIAIAFVLVLTTQNVLATGNRSDLKDYSINEVDDLYLGKEVKAIWKISYSEDETPVTVVKQKTPRGTEYEVHSKFFEVSYVASEEGFGVKKVRKASRNVHRKVNDAVLNQEQMKKQQIITPNNVGDDMALGLIASFLPALINDGYTHLLN